jgi:hypothetical protein
MQASLLEPLGQAVRASLASSARSVFGQRAAHPRWAGALLRMTRRAIAERDWPAVELALTLSVDADAVQQLLDAERQFDASLPPLPPSLANMLASTPPTSPRHGDDQSHASSGPRAPSPSAAHAWQDTTQASSGYNNAGGDYDSHVLTVFVAQLGHAQLELYVTNTPSAEHTARYTGALVAALPVALRALATPKLMSDSSARLVLPIGANHAIHTAVNAVLEYARADGATNLVHTARTGEADLQLPPNSIERPPSEALARLANAINWLNDPEFASAAPVDAPAAAAASRKRTSPSDVPKAMLLGGAGKARTNRVAADVCVEHVSGEQFWKQLCAERSAARTMCTDLGGERIARHLPQNATSADHGGAQSPPAPPRALHDALADGDDDDGGAFAVMARVFDTLDPVGAAIQQPQWFDALVVRDALSAAPLGFAVALHAAPDWLQQSDNVAESHNAALETAQQSTHATLVGALYDADVLSPDAFLTAVRAHVCRASNAKQLWVRVDKPLGAEHPALATGSRLLLQQHSHGAADSPSPRWLSEAQQQKEHSQ